MKTLLADVDAEIDSTLYAAMRAIEERAILLRQFAGLARDENDLASAQRYLAASDGMARRAQHIKAMAAEQPIQSMD
jgi:hypothetical protein